MGKIIAREVNPEESTFEFYFDDDGLKSAGGKNCAVYIVTGDRWGSGFNKEEYDEIKNQADRLAEDFEDIINNERWRYDTFKEAMEANGISYGSRKCHLLKEWAKGADTSDTDVIAEYLTITTGEKWAARAFCGYSQGDYCEVVYCTARHSEEHITEVGKFWHGCGAEFSIDDCYGYYVIDSIRWREGETLRNALADMYGCKPEELEIYLYDGEEVTRRTKYKLMDAA